MLSLVLLALAPVILASIEVALGLIAVPPGGACENAVPKGVVTIVLIDITSSNAEANTPVASKFTFIKVLEAAKGYNGYILEDNG